MRDINEALARAKPRVPFEAHVQVEGLTACMTLRLGTWPN